MLCASAERNHRHEKPQVIVMEAAMPSHPQAFVTAGRPFTRPPGDRPLASPEQGRHRRTTPRPAIQCEAVAYTPQNGRCFQLGSHPATTPRLALRWLRHRARHIADQLDPPAAQPVRHWIGDDTEQERALSLLACGENYTFTIYDDATRYALSAHAKGNAS
jgi:hypothetical protein